MSSEAGPEFLSALTAFVNLVLAGRCPSDVAPMFFGGRLLALSKKSGGFWPIVIGFTLRRLASKCANSYGINHLKALRRTPPVMRRWEWRSVWGSGWTCSHMNVVVVQWLMLEASIALFERRHPARQSDTILWMTWLLVAFQQLAFPSPRNPQACLVPTGNAAMDFPSFPDKTARRFAGMWQSSVR